jgi:hypothetical protein
MPGDLQAIMDAAEQAAASNDFPTAARHLRDAAALQESTLGPAHPDLANTLNNLGVVCERLGDILEAEPCFRRAYAIATSAFPADHPFVATSRANLEEFCRLHGRSLEPDAPVEHDDDDRADATQDDAGSIDLDVAGSVEQDAAGSLEQDPAYTALRSSTAIDRPERGIPFGVIVSITVVLMTGLGWMAWRLGASPTLILTPAPDVPASATTPEPPPEVPTTLPPIEAKPAPPSTPPTAPQPTAPSTSTGSPTVVDARVCRSLETTGAWQCDAVTADVAPGAIYFFTRIAADRDTTIQHRWYFGDELRQSTMLSIQANSAGYRTYSRTTIAPERAGAWRVEVRTEDGRVLREERFTVR